MKTYIKQNKQTIELSDEELKQVTGGRSRFLTVDNYTESTPPCPSGYIQIEDSCYQE